jgi:hypothetical protein
MNLLKRTIQYLPYNEILRIRIVNRKLNEFIKSKIILIPKNKQELYFMICTFDFVKYDLTKIESLNDDDLYLFSCYKLVKLNSSEYITTTGMNYLCNCKKVIFNDKLLSRDLNCNYYFDKYSEVELVNSFICNHVINLVNSTTVTIKNCVLINVKLVNSSLYSLRVFNSCLQKDFLQNIFYVDFCSLKSTFK